MKKIKILAFAALALIGLLAPAKAQDRSTLRVVVHANLQILDPVWTTAFITGRHAYLIYDTLYGMDSRFVPQPQMVERHETSADLLTWRFTLRDGLKFHDGAAVRSADVVA